MEEKNAIDKRMTLFALTWPILIESFLRILFVNVDTFMLSQYSDKAAASVGAAGQYVSITVLLYQVIASGTSIVISQNLGAKNNRKAVDVALVSLVVNLLMGVLVSVALVSFSGKILGIMNFESEVYNYASDYLLIMGMFSFVTAMNATTTAILRSYGFVKVSVFVNIGANLVNVVGNMIAIKGFMGIPVLGVKGVAASTVISQCVSLVCLFAAMLRNIGQDMKLKRIFSFPRTLFKEVLRDVFKIGGPSAGENLSYNISQIVITAIINLMGTYALTARFYVFSIMFFMMMCALSIGQATQIMVGYLIGAGKMDDAYKTCLRSLRISVFISFVTAIVFASFGKILVGLFTDNEQILSMGSIMLAIAIIIEPGRAFNIVLGGSLKGAGDARFILFLGIGSMWGIAVLMSYVLGIHFGLGLIGVWIAFASDEWFRGIMMLLRWRSRVWESKSVVSLKPAINPKEECLINS